MLHILIAPNSFKNSLTAQQVASAMEAGFRSSALDAHLTVFPIADGGDYTAHLLGKYLNGTSHTLTVSGAYGDPTEATYSVLPNGKTALIEVAETSGFRSIPGQPKNLLTSTTRGLGELIKHNISAGITDFLICLGGSATVDGGLGMLQALGLKCFDSSGRLLQARPDNFDHVSTMDASDLVALTRQVNFLALCDVSNPLLGATGAARVFGPQKGASKRDVDQLEAFLTRWDRLSQQLLNRSLSKLPGAGAAGGLGAALGTYLEARMEKGADYFCEITGFHQALAKADLLITGEGSIDRQSLQGKAPVVVAQLAQERRIPVIGLAGRIPQAIPEELQQCFTMLWSIGHQPEDLKQALSHTAENLTRSCKQIAEWLAVCPPAESFKGKR